MKKHLIVAAVILAAFAAGLGSFLLLAPEDRDRGMADIEAAAQAQPVRASSHRLTSPERSELTVVEFLDFECESCGAVYPAVEKLREEYGDRVTFIARYFPMPGHRNGGLAARTVEAAAQQGKFEEMYGKLFATQAQWGEADESKEPLFRTYAEELGLDLKKFTAALNDPATAERIEADQRDGLGLGVQGTPTFFVDGLRIPNPGSYEEFRALIEKRLARK
ncbi:thioredoxin domain-containing protein [Streptomyces sp. NPDC089173]|uniref:DsbA family protein n=1 Tax=Streptomyces sp. NPDC089173 TaxID=3154965 RepID=UPI00344D761A